MNTDFLCETKLAKESPFLHQIFKDAVFSLQHILSHYQSLFPSYTDHTTLHSMQVAAFCNDLIAENIEALNVSECFVLLMSCYLHDSGMGIDREVYESFCQEKGLSLSNETDAIQEVVRRYHNDLSVAFLRKEGNFFDFPTPSMQLAVEQVSRGHRKANLFDPTDYPDVLDVSPYGEIRLPYFAALIRLADEIDIAADRIPEVLVDYEAVSKNPISVREFEKHHAIRHLLIEPERFIMQVHTEDDSLFADIAELRDKVMETLRYCRDVVEQRTPFSITQKTVELERI